MPVDVNKAILAEGLSYAVDIPRSYDHGLSSWFCMEDGVATYAAPYKGTTIYRLDPLDSSSILINSTTEPQRGTFNIYSGSQYYADRPIYLIEEEHHYRLVPVSSNGYFFGVHYVRNPPITFFCTSVGEETGSLTYYQDGSGVLGTPLRSSSIIPRQITTGSISFTSDTYVYFESDVPCIMTTKATTTDYIQLNPAETRIYYRTAARTPKTISGSNPSYYTGQVAVDDYPIIQTSIADGSGGDAESGIGINNISNTYAFGNNLSDYMIVSMYPNTVITASYYSASAWHVHEIHDIPNGELDSPQVVYVDGDNDGTWDGSGASAFISGSGIDLWKWESNNPFYIRINDVYNDEITLLGWMSGRTHSLKNDNIIPKYNN